MDLEQKAIERIKTASEMSFMLYKKPPYYALSIGCDDQSKDYFPIEYCPWCGRKLQEET